MWVGLTQYRISKISGWRRELKQLKTGNQIQQDRVVNAELAIQRDQNTEMQQITDSISKIIFETVVKGIGNNVQSTSTFTEEEDTNMTNENGMSEEELQNINNAL